MSEVKRYSGIIVQPLHHDEKLRAVFVPASDYDALLKQGSETIIAAGRKLVEAMRERDAALADIERLRAALTSIVDAYAGLCECQDAQGDRTPLCRKIASAALRGEEGK